MGARVTAGQIKEVIETKIADSVIQASMIDTANLYVDTHLLSFGHSKDILEKIELYLAAHYVALTEERGSLRGGSFGDASEFLSDLYTEGFRATRFGQVALGLDTSGTLARLGQSTLKAEFKVV